MPITENDNPDGHQAEWVGPDRRLHAERQKVKFDATINLGHVLTFVGFIVAGFTAWTTLDKRVTVIEERAVLQAHIDRTQDGKHDANMAVIKDSLADIKLQINRLSERQDRRSVP